MRRAGAIAVRGLLAAGLAALAACGSSEPPDAPLGANRLTVVVLVVDSLMPEEIGPSTPNLLALKQGGTVNGSAGAVTVGGGTFYPESRAVYAAETIPNHVAMMTGVYPQRSGIPTNDFVDLRAGGTADTRLSIPEKLTANTLFTWIRQRCRDTGVNPSIRTGATLSKKYLYDIFLGDGADAVRANDDPDVFNVPPDSYWDPQDSAAYIGSPDEHTPDIPTMTQARAQLPDVDFFFINLGDVDRSAHAGGTSFRNGVMPDTDAQVGELVSDLQAAGRWASTVLFVVSDHGMDYSAPGPATAISSQATLDALGAACHNGTPLLAVPSGQGTEAIYALDRSLAPYQRQAVLRDVRACLTDAVACAARCHGTPAPVNAGLIAGAWYTTDDPLDPAGNMPLVVASRSQNLGDLTVFAAATGKFGEPTAGDANAQIPGHHGHPLTLRSTFLVTGGSPWVKAGQVVAPSVASPTPLDRLPEQSENVDIAPTVAWLLGLGLAPGHFPDYAEHAAGFDGRILKEAFTQFDGDARAASPTVCGRFD